MLKVFLAAHIQGLSQIVIISLSVVLSLVLILSVIAVEDEFSYDFKLS